MVSGTRGPDDEGELALLRAENTALRMQLADLKSQLEGTEAILDGYKQQLAGMRRSLSWRLSAPLRIVHRSARRA